MFFTMIKLDAVSTEVAAAQFSFAIATSKTLDPFPCSSAGADVMAAAKAELRRFIDEYTAIKDAIGQDRTGPGTNTPGPYCVLDTTVEHVILTQGNTQAGGAKEIL